MEIKDLLAPENGPPWLPATVAESRKLIYVGQLLTLVFSLIAVIVGLVRILTGNLYDGVASLGLAAVGILVLFMLNDNVFKNLDQGKFKPASDALLIWAIIGFFVYVIPGVILLFGYLKLQGIFQPQYHQYQTQQYQASQGQQAAPPQPSAPQEPAPTQPAPGPAPAAEQHKEKKVEMTKCRKCGVNYPSFMHSCPNCNEPRR
jgi:hypothetical protein